MQEPEKKVQERQSVQVATLEWHLLSDMGSGLVFEITAAASFGVAVEKRNSCAATCC